MFALGALLAIADSGSNANAVSVASVSGGSLANAGVATRLAYPDAAANDVEAAVKAVARTIAQGPVGLPTLLRRLAPLAVGLSALAAWVLPWLIRGLDDGVRVAIVAGATLIVGLAARLFLTGGGTLFGWFPTWLYFAALVALAEATYAGIPRLDAGNTTRAGLYVAGTSLLLIGFGLRGRVTARAFAHTLFPDGPRTKLSDLPLELDHVICATDLHAGEHVYFAGSFVYAYRFGLGRSDRLRLHTAVQTSAGFPGAFPVTWVKRARFDFTQTSNSESRTPWRLALVDGGVYDNMGDQWAHGVGDRQTPGTRFRTAEQLVVVNSSAGMAYGGLRKLVIPVVGAFLAMWREKSVLYDNGTSQRRRALVSQFDAAELSGDGLRGTLVHITQSPYRQCRAFEAAGPPWQARAERATRAREWIERDGSWTEAHWQHVVNANFHVPTTLVGFDVDTCARLLHHAYVLAAVNLHIVLGHPLPGVQRNFAYFRALASTVVP